MALDVGQSGMRTSIRVDGREVHEAEYPGALTDRPLLPQVAAVIRASVEASGVTCDRVGIGSTGLGANDTPAALLGLVSGLGVRQVDLAHDSITSYLGALGNRTGVVTASGTGVVTLAVGEERVHRVDGWGYLVGDAGSGYWIGRSALDAVLRAYDGRGPETSLRPLVEADFGPLADLYLVLQADEYKVSRVASWARVVSEHAAAGDRVCIDISQRAGAELAWSAVTGLRIVGETRPDPAVSVLGKVFANPLVLEAFQTGVQQHHPMAAFLSPRATGLEGAALLSEVAREDALFSRIARAEA